MKVKILEYKIDRGNKVKVQSHNKRKNKWIKNENFGFHKKVSGSERCRWVNEYEEEIE